MKAEVAEAMLIILFNPFSGLRLEKLEVQNLCKGKDNLFGISIDRCGKSIGIVADVTQVEGLRVVQKDHYNTSFTGLSHCIISN